MSTAQACHTFEAALEMAIEMENEGYRHYLRGLRIVRDANARDILKEMALDELDHKYALEKALIEGFVGEEHQLQRPVPTMNLDYVLTRRELSPDSGVREALAYAIHLEKNAVDFYQRMARGCAGAPMAEMFEKIGNDESRHLQKLEDLYETYFLSEN
ncbi:ferritin [Geothermobacter hydrogeniphilus]|uniref:Ferritin n=1 Tax=Geothermobacter hydrogeniphilus TaxID=1969733 RepID=A0A2K2HCQ6_9BACT|nr:ferritin family protein [Geothermobacter hydrogeniphilus]PNU21085.1 ferritin [Geothermobacter hydrogeniphilus]